MNHGIHRHHWWIHRQPSLNKKVEIPAAERAALQMGYLKMLQKTSVLMLWIVIVIITSFLETNKHVGKKTLCLDHFLRETIGFLHLCKRLPQGIFLHGSVFEVRNIEFSNIDRIETAGLRCLVSLKGQHGTKHHGCVMKYRYPAIQQYWNLMGCNWIYRDTMRLP